MPVKCHECTLTFKFMKSFKKHEEKFHPDNFSLRQMHRESINNQLVCGECGRKFSKKSTLKVHTDAVHKGIKYPCSLCDVKISHQKDLIRHIQSVHENKKRVNKCKQCDFKTSNWKTMKKHRSKIHNDATTTYLMKLLDQPKKHRNIECSRCGKHYFSNSNLNKHKKICNGARRTTENKKIEPMARTSQYKKSVKRAVKVTNIKVKNEALERTENKNNDKQNTDPITCSKCPGKTFLTATSLKRHDEAVHLGVTYNCDKCNYKASQKCNLTIHIDNVHEKMRYQCSLCSFTAVRKCNIREHMDKKHDGSTEEPKKVTLETPATATPEKQDSLQKLSIIEKLREDIKLSEYYCDFCMFETEVEHSLTNHLALDHYDDIFGR